MDKNEIIRHIESWEAEQTAAAVAVLKKDKALEQEIMARYQFLLDAVSGKTLKALAGFPQKWDKLSTVVKAELLASYPPGLPFYMEALNLNASRRVDAWRDSHYKNQIPKLPETVGRMKNLTALHLEHQLFEEFPEVIGELENLEVLNLKDNNMRLIPDALLKLKKLRVLILSENYGLKTIPDLSLLPDLEEIDFKGTQINTLPDDFFQLKNIRKITAGSSLDANLQVIRKMLAAFPDAQIETHARKALEVEDNANNVQYLGQEKISIDEYNLNHLPESLFEADAVKELEIKCWNLTELADKFDQLPTLEKLHIRTGNNATVFPPSIFTLKNLKHLYINGGFHSLPDNIDGLESLEYLEMDVSRVKQLPATFSKLKNLTTWIVKYNEFDAFAAVAELPALTTLRLEHHVPPFSIGKSLRKLTALKDVMIKPVKQITDDLYNLPQSIVKLDLYDDSWNNEKTVMSFGKIVNHFHNVANLSLKNMDLTDDSTAIESNHALKELSLDALKMTGLPDSISSLKALRDFTFFSSKLESLNPAIYDCPELVNFRTSKTFFTTIPDGISRMEKLERIGFENGNLEKLPEEIMEMKQLEKIVLEDCPLYKDKEFKALIRKKIKGIKIVKGWYD